MINKYSTTVESAVETFPVCFTAVSLFYPHLKNTTRWPFRVDQIRLYSIINQRFKLTNYAVNDFQVFIRSVAVRLYRTFRAASAFLKSQQIMVVISSLHPPPIHTPSVLIRPSKNKFLI